VDSAWADTTTTYIICSLIYSSLRYYLLELCDVLICAVLILCSKSEVRNSKHLLVKRET
jgi:hypothetical protein